jgi:cation diffusion facilitator CzcD-associated flavoprotein CzcO
MLRRAGYDNVTVFERDARLGGVWHQNTYPGAACDVPSHLYEFSFAPNATAGARVRYRSNAPTGAERAVPGRNNGRLTRRSGR